MQSQQKFFLGMDVSKEWVDLAVVKVVNHERRPMINKRFDNTRSGLKDLDLWLRQQGVSFDEHSLLVIENTGVYHRLIWQYCTEKGLPLHIGNAAAIKWSLGIARGKSDVIDCRRLCEYCYKNREDLRATHLYSPELVQLKDLLTARSRLLQQLGSVRNYLRELKHTSSAQSFKVLEQAHQAAQQGLKASLKAVEAQIRAALAANASLKTNYKRLLSVPGIGHLSAVYLLCCTNNFALRLTGKQLASYAGVAPFPHSSGKSIKGRNQVHHMANKELKRLFTMGALSLIKNSAEFKAYYQRKIQQGKHHSSVLNAIKNKIALRAVSVVMNEKLYTSNYPKNTQCA